MKMKILAILFGVLFSPVFSPGASTMTVLQLNVEQLTALAEKVFAGRCLSVEAQKDSSGRMVQEVTFEVTEMIKGESTDKITFRQIVPPAEEERVGSDVTVRGLFRELPQYEVGEEALIFLSKEGYSGLTAPVGLHQGKFKVETEGSGQKQIVNGMGNRGLFIGWQKSSHLKAMTLNSQEKSLLKISGGEVPYSEFVSIVKKLVAR